MKGFLSKSQSPMSRGSFPRRGVLICFVGLDGSGKSSHAKSLLSYLSARGYSCSYSWGGIKPFLSYFFLALTWLLRYWKEEQEGGEYSVNPIGKAPKRICERALIPIFRFCIFTDYLIKALLKVRLPLILGKNVISDRYVYDLIVGLVASDLSTEGTIVKLLLRTVPTNSLVFFLDAPENVISARRNIPTNDLRKRRREYLLLARSNGFYILDSSVDFWKNQLEIRKRVLPHLGDHEA
jgi:thymidylate kinase